MSDFAILNELIKASVQVPIQLDQNQKRFFYLEEKQDNYGVTIRGISDETDIFVIDADQFPAPKMFFQGSRGECKRADFIVITRNSLGNFIIIIEMKAGSGDNPSIQQQLKGSQCLATYIQNIGQIFWKESSFLAHYVYRFVSLKNMKINKKTRYNPKSFPLHDSPEHCLQISPGQSLQLKQLITVGR